MITLSAGVGKVDITPPVGVELQGYVGRDRPSSGVLERLYAKVIIFDNGLEKIILITSDLIGVSAKFVNSVRREIGKIAEVKPSRIMISASHTHCGPATLSNIASRKGVNREYLVNLKNRMLKAVVLAIKDMEPVKLGVSIGKANFNINRRLKKDKSVIMAPNKRGLCDNEVGVVKVDNLKGNTKAIIINFTCHPTTWGGFFLSPDYPGYTQKSVESNYKKAIALFTNGACGDIRPNLVDKEGKCFKGGSREDVKRLGKILAKEVIQIAEKVKPDFNHNLKGISRTVKLPLSKPLPLKELKGEISRTKNKIEKFKKEKGPLSYILHEKVMLKWAKKTHNLVKNDRVRRWVKAEIQIFLIGDLVFVGLPGEIFCEIGRAIKRLFRPAKAFVIGYANGCVGYIPTAKALSEGGYEPNDSIKIYNLPARFSSKVGRIILDNVKDVASSIQEEKRGQAAFTSKEICQYSDLIKKSSLSPFFIFLHNWSGWRCCL